MDRRLALELTLEREQQQGPTLDRGLPTGGGDQILSGQWAVSNEGLIGIAIWRRGLCWAGDAQLASLCAAWARLDLCPRTHLRRRAQRAGRGDVMRGGGRGGRACVALGSGRAPLSQDARRLLLSITA